MKQVKYKRVLIKLSGGALAGQESVGFEQKAVEHIVNEVLSVRSMGVEVALLVGGGNIFRGQLAKIWGIDRAEADNIGMLGTVVNSLMLRGAFKSKTDSDVRVMTAMPMESVAEPFIRLRAIHHLEKGTLVILAGGIGQPYVTTDYPAVQRSLELACDAILVAKQGVDGVYTADPKKDSSAVLCKSLSYDDFIQRKIQVMDQSAVLLARDNNLPIHLFNFNQVGTMKRIISGEILGTVIAPGSTLQIQA